MMKKSLSYYAVRHGKAVFGLEASKAFPVKLRAYYHLCIVESLLRQAGVRFARNFELTPKSVRRKLRADSAFPLPNGVFFCPWTRFIQPSTADPCPNTASPLSPHPSWSCCPAKKKQRCSVHSLRQPHPHHHKAWLAGIGQQPWSCAR